MPLILVAILIPGLISGNFYNFLKKTTLFIIFFHIFLFLAYLLNIKIRIFDNFAVFFIFFYIFLVFFIKRYRWKKFFKDKKRIFYSFFIIILSLFVYFYYPAFSGIGDSYVFLSQAERISNTGMLIDKAPFRDSKDIRYKASFLPLFLSIFDRNEKIDVLYKFLPSMMIMLSILYYYGLLTVFFDRKSALYSIFFFFSVIFLYPSQISEAMVFNLPKIYIPYVFFPAFFYFLFKKEYFLIAGIFFITAFNHIFYSGLLLVMYFSYLLIRILIKKINGSFKSEIVLSAIILLILGVFFFMHSVNLADPVKNPFFKNPENTKYIKRFTTFMDRLILSPKDFFQRFGFFLKGRILTLIAYISSLLIFNKNKKLFLFMFSQIFIIIILGFNPFLTPLFTLIVTPFKTSALFQAFMFPIGWAIMINIAIKSKRSFFSRIIPIVFLAFPLIVLLAPKANPFNNKFPKITDFMAHNNKMLLSDELTSFRLSAFSGCSVFLSPAPFSSPAYDYAECKKEFTKFLIYRNKESIPKGVDFILLPNQIRLNINSLKPIMKENGMTLWLNH